MKYQKLQDSLPKSLNAISGSPTRDNENNSKCSQIKNLLVGVAKMAIN